MPSLELPAQDNYAEHDCLHWLPSALDPEPEQCWCLHCGEALPCACSTARGYTPLHAGDAR
jgi:hypothetical protein